MKKVIDCVRSMDMLGQPVSLTYKGNRLFQSCLGGIVTILLVLLIVAIFGQQLYDSTHNLEYYGILGDNREIEGIYGQKMMTINTDENNLAVRLSFRGLDPSGAVRVVFTQKFDNGTTTTVESVYCSDMYKDKIYEKPKGGLPNYWYEQFPPEDKIEWICPNTAEFYAQNYTTYLIASVYKCSSAMENFADYISYDTSECHDDEKTEEFI